MWQVRVFTGRGTSGRPTQVAVTVRGGKRDALREAARPEAAPRRGAEGRTVSDALRAWLERNEGSYSPAILRGLTTALPTATHDARLPPDREAASGDVEIAAAAIEMPL